MNKLKIWLSCLLGLQLVVIVGVYIYSNIEQTDGEAHSLLGDIRPKMSKLILDDGEKSISISRDENGWRLTTFKNLPVDESKLEHALDRLFELETNWPVAKTAGSHTRFKLTEASYERRIRFYDRGSKVDSEEEQLLAELLIGTSPGFKKVHLRLAGEDAVYALPLNAYDFPTEANEWLDKSLLAVKNIQTITGPDYSVTKSNGIWELNAPTQKSNALEIDTEKVNELVSTIESQQITGVAEDKHGVTEDKYSALNKDWIPVAVSAESANESHQFYFHILDEQFLVKLDGLDVVFTLSSNDFEKLAQTRIGDLTQSKQ